MKSRERGKVQVPLLHGFLYVVFIVPKINEFENEFLLLSFAQVPPRATITFLNANLVQIAAAAKERKEALMNPSIQFCVFGFA